MAQVNPPARPAAVIEAIEDREGTGCQAIRDIDKNSSFLPRISLHRIGNL
jgi:hypothetical protein